MASTATASLTISQTTLGRLTNWTQGPGRTAAVEKDHLNLLSKGTWKTNVATVN